MRALRHRWNGVEKSDDDGGIAQLGEHLLCKQGVIGSIPIISTRPHEVGFVGPIKSPSAA